MAFNLDAARKEGYSDAEIADYLASQTSFNLAGARAEGYSDTEIVQHLISGAPAPKTRTTGEAFKDVGASVVSGLGSLVQLPGQLYGLATGDFSETGALGAGKALQEKGEAMKSAGLKAREAERAAKVAEAEKEGQLSAFSTALGETITDPALLTSFLAEQVPQLIVPGGAATVAGKAALARGAAKGLEAAAARQAAIKAGTRAAVGAGAVQQGAGVGAETYKAVYDRMVAQGADPSAAADQAVNLARAAGAGGAVISLLANALPITRQLEEVLAGQVAKRGVTRAALGTAAGETLGELIEEPGGRVAQNIALQQVDPTQALTAGLGETAAMAMIGGAGLGGAAGALSGRRGGAEQAVAAEEARREQTRQRVLAAMQAKEQAQADAAAQAEAAEIKRAQKLAEPVRYEGKQGEMFPKGEAPTAPYVPDTLEKIETEFAKLQRQEQTPETQQRMQELAQAYERKAAEQPPVPEAAPAQPELPLEAARTLTDYEQELARLSEPKGRKSPEVKARIAELEERIAPLRESLTPRGFTKEGQGRLFTPTELKEAGLKRMREPTEAEPTAPTPDQLKRAGQQAFDFTAPAEAQGEAKPVTGTTGIAGIEDEAPTREVTEPVPEPKLAPKRAVPAELQPVMDKLTTAGVRPEVQAWAEKGQNRPFLRKLMSMTDMAPQAIPEARKALKLKEGSEKAEVFDALFPTPGVPAFRPAPGAGESRLGLLGQLGAIAPAEPPAPRAGEPVGRGVVPAGGAAPATAKPEGKPTPALEPHIAEFTTAKGSTYQVFGDGTTLRTKAARADVGHEGDVGKKPRSVKTIYVDSDASVLSAAGVSDMKGARVVLKNGRATLVWPNPKTGKLGTAESNQNIPYHTEPAVGRYPLELWQPRKDVPGYEAYAGMHAGNKITALKDVAAPTTRAKPAPALNARELWEENNVEGAGTRLSYDELTPERRAVWNEAVGNNEGTTELYEDLAGEQAKQEKRTFKDIDRPELEATLSDLATTPAAPMRALPEAVRANALPTLKRLEKNLAEGKLTEAEYHAEIQLLIDKLQQRNGTQLERRAMTGRRRGADWIVAQLRRGVADQTVPRNEADFAEWLLEQNPDLANDLGISMSARDGEGVRGEYNPLARVITLFTSSDLGEGTAVHEILHHTERMMPKDVQQGVMDEWNQKWNLTYVMGDEKVRNALVDMLSASLGDKEAHARVIKYFQDGVLNYDQHYQLYSVSEFWTVNATRILSGRHAAGTWAAKAVQWFKEFVQRIKGMLGLASDAPVLKALEAVLQGEGVFQPGAQMLADRTAKDMGQQVPATPKYDIENPVKAKYTPSSIVDSSRVMEDQPGYIARTFKSFIEVFSAAEGVSLTDRLRTKIVFEGASLETKLNTLFDNKVRDEATNLLNPMGLIMQAKDSTKLLGAFFEQGKLVWDEAGGRWVVGDSDKGSISKMQLAIKDWADANNMEYDRASAELSKMFEAVRLDEMRTANKEEGTEFPIHKLAPNDPRAEDAQIDDRLDAFKATPEAQAIFKMMEDLRHEMIDNMVAVGRLSEEMGQLWKDASGYVPFDRLQEFSDNFRGKRTKGRGIAQLGELPKFVGSTEREVGNTVDNYVKVMSWMVQQTLDQAATSRTLKTLELMGYSEYVGKNKPSNAHNVETYYKGQKVYYTVPSRWDVMAFKDLSDPKGSIVKALSGISNVLRKTITAMPWFALKQVTDDIQRAFVTSGVKNPYAIIAPTLMTFFRVAGYEFVLGKQHPLSREMGQLGVVGDYDIDTLNPSLALQHKLGIKKRGKFGELLHRLDSVTRASDLAVRKSIYEQTLKETKGSGHADGDLALATTRAREFINFRRHGSSSTVRVMTATIPFFNAYLQGMDVLYRAATGKGSGMGVGSIEAKKVFWNRILTMTAFASIYALAVSGDDDYEEMDLRTRDGNWIIPGYGKLSVPGELGVLYKLIPERVIGYLRRAGTAEDQEAAEATITALRFAYEQYGGRLTPIPSAVKPVLENLMNYSTLRGRELVGAYQQTLPASRQRSAQTSELAVAIADFTRDTFSAEVSPIKIDNFLNGYFGSVAGLTTMLTDQLLNPNRPDRPLHKYALLSNYMYAPVGTQRKDEFYELREKVMAKHNALKDLEKTDINKAVKYAEDNEQDLMYVPFVTSALEQLEKTRAYKKFLRSADGAAAYPTPGEREKLIEEADRLEVELVRPLRELKVVLRVK